MKTLIEQRPRWYKRQEGDIGIEIETENIKSYIIPHNLNWWMGKTDGSLRRHGVEYITPLPLKYKSEQYYSSLSEFELLDNLIPFIQDSPYTSLHVHLNMQKANFKQIANFIVLFTLLENVLSEYCGPDRVGNLFCLRCRDAEQSYFLYEQFFNSIYEGEGMNFLGSLNENLNKYSAMNIVPLKKFGTIEIRVHGGTTKRKEIERWIDLLWCIYSKSMNSYNNPQEILNSLKDKKDYKGFITYIFGDLSKYLLVFDVNSLIQENLYYCAKSISNIKDWKIFGETAEILIQTVTFNINDLQSPGGSLLSTVETVGDV